MHVRKLYATLCVWLGRDINGVASGDAQKCDPDQRQAAGPAIALISSDTSGAIPKELGITWGLSCTLCRARSRSPASPQSLRLHERRGLAALPSVQTRPAAALTARAISA
jgi:hypothetical protein